MTLERRFLATGCWQDCIGPGLPAGIETEERLPRRFAENTADIFALIKHQLPDEQLSQPALLIWPGIQLQKSKLSGAELAITKG